MEDEAQVTEGAEDTPKKAPPNVKGLIALVAGLAGLTIWITADKGSSGGEPSWEELRWDAERVCKEDFIARRLKAPATAEYDLTTTGGPTTYTVSGTVDAENSFGAMLRSEVTCVVADEGDRWRLVSIDGLD